MVLFLLASLVLVGAAILLLRKPSDDHSWSGDLAFATTTPTLTLLPEAGWWGNLPSSAFSPTP